MADGAKTTDERAVISEAVKVGATLVGRWTETNTANTTKTGLLVAAGAVGAEVLRMVNDGQIDALITAATNLGVVPTVVTVLMAVLEYRANR